MKAVYDITVMLGSEAIDYPGDTPYSRESIRRIADGDTFQLSKLVMSTHSGTHLDVPAHFLAGGRTIDEYGIEDFVLPAQIVQIADPKCIRVAELQQTPIRPGTALLFKTSNSTTGRNTSGVFSEDFVYLSAEAAAHCAQRGVRLVGLDYITIDKADAGTFAAHHNLMTHDVLVLEGINLKDVPQGDGYVLYCFPLKILGGEAAPVRAVLMKG